MKHRYSLLFIFFTLTALFAAPLSAQVSDDQSSGQSNIETFRPPNLPTPNQYRAGNGAPGPEYWQNVANYNIATTLYPKKNQIKGSETITYINNSPQNLDYLWLQLDQNLLDPTSIGARITDPNARFSGFFAEGGYDISNVRVVQDGETTKIEHYIKDSMLRIALKQPLEADGGTIKIKLDYSFQIPDYGADRMGQLKVEQGTIYEIAQWYPRMYVFDDVNGWNTMPYLGQGEFYLDYGTFDVAITVPHNMIVAATGVLQNPQDVLTEEQRKAFEQAKQSEETVTIISKEEVGDPSTRPEGDGMLTWRFQAENVRDFTWAASGAFIWDAAKIETHDGEPAIAQSFYPRESIAAGDSIGWEQSTQMIQHTIEFYSDFVGPYPYPVAINVAGIVGGMEYPMIVFCSWQARGAGLFGVTDHEFGHEWFPMMVGSDERRFTWMDEGFNTFINHYSEIAYFNQAPKEHFQNTARGVASNLVRLADSQPIMTYPDRVPHSAWGFLGYRKPGAGLVLLRQYILGPELFDSAFKEYFQRWIYKHPKPADFFRTIEDVAGENLDWFWNSWFFSTDKLNPALAGVEVNQQQEQTNIVVEQRGKMIMPLVVSVTLEDGSTKEYRIPEEAYYYSDSYTLIVDGVANRVELDPDKILPDVSPEAEIWTSSGGLQPAKTAVDAM